MNLAFMTLWEAGYLSPPDPPKEIPAVEPARLIDGCCSRCGRSLKKRGSHFHLKVCQ